MVEGEEAHGGAGCFGACGWSGLPGARRSTGLCCLLCRAWWNNATTMLAIAPVALIRTLLITLACLTCLRLPVLWHPRTLCSEPMPTHRPAFPLAMQPTPGWRRCLALMPRYKRTRLVAPMPGHSRRCSNRLSSRTLELAGSPNTVRCCGRLSSRTLEFAGSPNTVPLLSLNLSSPGDLGTA